MHAKAQRSRRLQAAVVACQIISAVSSKDLKRFNFTLLPQPGASGFRRTFQEISIRHANARHTHVSGSPRAATWLAQCPATQHFHPADGR
jgi:hypothetical protein